MELLEGESLGETLVREGQLAIPRVIDIIAQTGDALIEAHSLGYVHRDLKPRNIFLTIRKNQHDFVKLLNFGLSKLILPDAAAARPSCP